ncbi:MAG: glycine cleavage system protein H [Holophagales bacterium]|jgi:glycine cleavage system H protein|nr:glycine cleavage system protein H [Holophagales bacterium]
MVALLVILTIVVALAVDSLVLHRQARTVAAEALQPIVAMKLPQPPQGVFLDTAHTWLRITSDGRLRVGIDDFLAEAVGQIDKVDVPAQGASIERGQPLFTLTVKGRKLVIPSPASGTFMSANAKTQSDPNAVVRDPYGAGWVASIWTRDHHAAITPLRIGAAATHFLREELHRLADFMVPSGSMASVPVMADGGLPGKGSAASLDDKAWDAFSRQFVVIHEETTPEA